MGQVGYIVIIDHAKSGMQGHRRYVTKPLLTGSEEREVLGVGSIPVAILPSCQNMKTFAILLHKHIYMCS